MEAEDKEDDVDVTGSYKGTISVRDEDYKGSTDCTLKVSKDGANYFLEFSSGYGNWTADVSNKNLENGRLFHNSSTLNVVIEKGMFNLTKYFPNGNVAYTAEGTKSK